MTSGFQQQTFDLGSFAPRRSAPRQQHGARMTRAQPPAPDEASSGRRPRESQTWSPDDPSKD